MAKEMTPRERVYAAANHKEPDRVPISFGGTAQTGMSECPPDGRITSQLYEYLGIRDAEPVQIGDFANFVVNLDERVMQRMHSDMRLIFANAPPAIIEPDGTKTLPYLCGTKVKKVGFWDEPFGWPMRYMTTKKDIDEYPYWPDPDFKLPDMEGVIERARYLQEETDYFVVGDVWSGCLPVMGYGFFFTGMDRWLVDIKIRPKFYHQLAERLLEVNLAVMDQFYGGIGKYLDGVVMYDDLGTQETGLMSHNDYVEFYKPYTVRIIKNIRKYIRPEAKIILHSCGSIYWAIPDLIEIGVQILSNVQPLARNMEPWRLKKEFGNELCFLGGIDTQQLMPLGNKEQIREGIKKLIQAYAPSGGYIVGSSHTIEPDTPPENIVAGYDAAYEYGKYPISELTGQSFIDYLKGLKLHREGD